MKKSTFFQILFFLFYATACNNGHAELEQLAQQKHRLNCEMERLKSQTDSLWDSMSAYLEQALPPDMPPLQRTNMVNTRNAHLMTQFRIYLSLDTAIHGRVRLAQQKDEELAKKMKEVMARYEEAERKLSTGLEKSKVARILSL